VSKELAKLFAKRFIQRPDTKAVQFEKDAGSFHAGDWFPDSKVDAARRPNSPHLPHGFNMDHLLAHLAGERTYGHYLLDDKDQAKVFCFDIDIEKQGTYVTIPDFSEVENDEQADRIMRDSIVHVDGVDLTMRDLWMDRRRQAAPARTWLKYQLKTVAHMFASKIVELEIDCAVAYSGSKGVHVYGMTGTMPAKEVREAALLVLDMVDEFEPVRGKNFYRHKNDDPIHGFQNLSVEVFPKQDSLEGKNLGNLLRLPLGTNFKNPKDPTFFLDMTTPLGSFTPHADPVKLLTHGNPFA
jgi:hypothetical protein